MPIKPTCKALLICLVFAMGHSKVFAGDLHIAVASNFSSAIKTIVTRFDPGKTHHIVLSFGSSGKHYAQIKQGAPFDIFFSADVQRAARLEQEGNAITGSRFTYAIGKLALWSPQAQLIDAEGKVLGEGQYHHLALANPALAPYGVAAQEVLQHLGLWDQVHSRIVQGENISQAFQFIRSGNAELGFVAYAQIKHGPLAQTGSYWLVPQNLYKPIEQQAVIIHDTEIARAFVQFIRSDAALQLIRDSGYATP